MAEVILMPRLSDTMTEGVIASWHKNVGDAVKKGDLLAEVETDKATMELESYKDGTLLHIGTIKGGKLQVNDLLAIIGEKGENIDALINGQSTQPVPVVVNEEVSNEAPSANTSTPASPVDMESAVLMPRLSDTMTEGVIAAWHKNIGEDVKKGDVLAEIETDKATMELESYKNGKLLFQGAKKGEKIQVNDLLCIIGDSNINVEQLVASISNGGAQATDTTTTTQQPQQEISAQANSTTTPVAETNGRVLASPLARKLAQEKGISLASLQGSGDGGRIIKSDVTNYTPAKSNVVTKSTPAPAVAIPAVIPAVQAGNAFVDTPVSQMRKIIAKRLAESKFTAPHFYLTISVDMDNAIAGRAKMNENGDVKISFNDLVVKACSLALKKHPVINSSWRGDAIRQNNAVNIGIAVAVEDGLLVPVVRNADAKSLSQIAVEVKQYAKKASEKKLQPSDWEGNTFTISNLGMFGIDEFTAIINPPDACILAVGGIAQVPVVKHGAVVPGNVMKLTLSCDHRVVDGATGAAFLQTVKSFLEEPLRMLI